MKTPRFIKVCWSNYIWTWEVDVERTIDILMVSPTAQGPAAAGPRGELSPNLDRLRVGVDLGHQWSNYCILGLQGETLSEGKVQTRQAEVAEFFQALPPARVVMEVGTRSPWMQEIIAGEGHEVLVANPRLMEGRNGVSARMIGSMRRSWLGWGALMSPHAIATQEIGHNGAHAPGGPDFPARIAIPGPS